MEIKPSPHAGLRIADVTVFGARGDGIADDTAAIEHALAAGCGEVYFPQGQYVIGRGIVVDLARTGRVLVRGAGATLRHRGSGPALHVVGRHTTSADPKSLDEAVFAQEAAPHIEDLAIIGEHPESDGVCLEGTMQATLRGIMIRGCRHGVHLVKRNRNVIIDSVHVYDNRGIGVYLDHVDLHQINIHGSHISYNQAGGIKVERGNVRNVQISGNDIEYNHAEGGHDVWLIAGEKGLREGAITGNTIQALPHDGGANIRIDGYRPGTPLRAGLLSITGNHISSQSTNVRIADSHGITISGNNFARVRERNIQIINSELIAISANVLDDNTDHPGDRVKGLLLTDCRNCSVHGLIARTSYGGSPERGGTIEAVNCTALNIADCNLIGPRHRGVWLEDVCDSQVTGCSILHDAEQPMRAAIVEVGTSDRNLLTGNRVDVGEEGGIISCGTRTLVAQNLVVDAGES